MTEKKLNLKNPNDSFYKPLGEEAYSDESFLKEYSKLSGLEQALGEIKQDPQNTTAYKYAGGILHNDENFYYQTGISPRTSLEEASAEGRKGIEKYFSKNEKPILEKFGKEDYKHLVASVPLPKIKEEGEHKTIVDAINEFKRVQEIAEDPSKRNSYLSEKIKNVSKYVQNEFARYSSNESFAKQIFASYASYAAHNAQEVLENGDCEGVFKRSLSEAKKKAPYYNEMANVLYQKLAAKKE